MLHPFSDRFWYSDPQEATDRPTLGLLVGDRFSVMLDAGNSPAHAAAFLAAAKGQGLPAPALVALTHAHWDHSYGLCALPGLSIASRAAAETLQQQAAWQWGAAALQQYEAQGLLDPFCAEHMRAEYPDPAQIRVRPPDLQLAGRLDLQLGGCSLQLFCPPNPHSPDSLAAFCPEEGLLFLGDAIYEELAGGQWIPHPELAVHLAQTLQGLAFTRCFAGHTPPMSRDELFSFLASVHPVGQ